MDNSTNAITATLDESTIADIFDLLGTWGATIPNQPGNVKRLRTWRRLLESIEPEVRAKMAQSQEILKAAIQYVPGPGLEGRPRPLDWDGIDPTKPPLAGDQAQMALLLEEQEQWLKSGLISGPTTSSSEWPAVALLEAFARTGRPYPQINYALARSIISRAPGVLRAAIQMASMQDIEEVLEQPTPGSSSNPPIIRDLLSQQSVAEELVREGFLSKKALNTPFTGGRNGFFTGVIPLDRAKFWLDAGMRADVRSHQGRFAEEDLLDVRRPLSDILSFHRELNSGRIPEDQALATWRLAATNLMYRAESQEELPKDFVRSLAAPAPVDDGTPTGVISFLEMLEANRGHLVPVGRMDESFLQLIGHIQDEGGEEGLQHWIKAEGGPNRVFGFLMATIIHPEMKTTTPLGKIQDMARVMGASDELLAIELIQTPLLSSFRAEIDETPNGSMFTDIMAQVFSQKRLGEHEAWLGLIKKDNNNPLLNPFPSSKSLTRNPYPTLLLANIALGLPEKFLLSSDNRPLVWSLAACFPLIDSDQTLEGLSHDNTLRRLLIDLDIPALRALLEKAMACPGAGSWWQELDEHKQSAVHALNPSISAMFNEALLEEAIPEAERAPRPKIRF